MFYSLDKLKPKTITKKPDFFLLLTLRLFIHFRKKGTRNFLPILKKCFYSQFIKSLEFSFTPTKKFLVFIFWFQFIQRIEHKTVKFSSQFLHTLKSLIEEQTRINEQAWKKVTPCLLIY